MMIKRNGDSIQAHGVELEPRKINTKISYSLKDTEGNVIDTRDLYLSGVFTQAESEIIRRKLNRGQYFIPQQIGIESLNTEEVDQVWHTLNMDSMQFTKQPSIGLSCKEFFTRFATVVWNPAMINRAQHSNQNHHLHRMAMA